MLRTHPSKTSEWKNLPPKVKVYVADLTLAEENDYKVLEEACKGVDNIFHLASAVYNYNNTYDELINVNVVGTENLLNAYESSNKGMAKPMHIIYSSSVSVYGYKRTSEVLDENSELKPASPYSESKMMAEQVIKSFADANPLIKYTLLRFGTFYGSGYKSSFFKMFSLIEQGKAVYIGGGVNHITLIHEDDAVEALLLSDSSPKSLNKAYNITDGHDYTVKQLFEFAARSMGVSPPKRSVPHIVAKFTSRISNITYDELEFISSDRNISINKARSELGFEPVKKMEIEGKALVTEYINSKKH